MYTIDTEGERTVAKERDIVEGLDTEPVVRVCGEISLLPQHFGEDLKASKTRLLLDHRFQLVHYVDADGLEQTAAGTAAEVAPVLEQAGYVVKPRSTPI
jgi:hypothetical protein